MDAHQRGASPGAAPLVPHHRRLIAGVGSIFLLGMLALGTISARSNPPSDTYVTLPSQGLATQAPPTLVPTVTTRSAATSVAHVPVATRATASTVPATAVASPATKKSAASTPDPRLAVGRNASDITPTATLTEAQTPLHLTDPVGTGTSVDAAPTPWWQSTFAVLWRLALVIGLIYLVMRALAAFKARGFPAPGAQKASRTRERAQPFFEKIEEIRLAPNHTLHAVRAGDRILLLAQTANMLRPVGEILSLEEAPEAEIETQSQDLVALPGSVPFERQMMRAWAKLWPPRRAALPEHELMSDAETLGRADVISIPARSEAEPSSRPHPYVEASWVTVEPDIVPAASPASDQPIASPPAPRRGVARSAEKPFPPETLDPAREREILWHAEEHGAGAAAAKFGLTHQRVTALRAKYERERAQRRPAAGTIDQTLGDATATPPLPSTTPPPARRAKPARSAEPGAPLAAARASLARQAYTARPPTSDTPEPARPSPAPSKRKGNVPGPTLPSSASTELASDVASQAAQVAQALASRLGIKVPAGKP